MSKRRGIRFLILVEDDALERFVRQVLLVFGFQPRDIRIKRPYGTGRGSAKAWVTRNYPEEVRIYRAKASSQENIAIVIGTDADNMTVKNRTEELDAALVSSGFPRRQPAEKILLIIPKWNIETWLVNLNSIYVDEDRDDYKKDPAIRNVDYAEVAKVFVARYRSLRQGNVDAVTPSSMILTFEEMKRFGL